MNMNYRNKTQLLLLILGLMFQVGGSAQQQMENSMSLYFQNRMLWNPGFTGADGNKIYALQNRSWVGFDGAPVMTSISGELLFGTNSSAGVQIMNDVTGVQIKTFGIVNYAFRIKLIKEEQLRIGIAFAFAGERLNGNYIDQGGVVDPVITNSINNQIRFDGNIGFAYIMNKLTLGLSFYRLKENLSVKSIESGNLAFAQMGGTYDINLSDKVLMKPITMLRLYRGTEAVIDIGTQFDFNKQVNTMLLYQTTGNIRAGAGIQLKDLANVNFFYNTNVIVANIASQQYELGIAFHLKGKKQE